jgi:hypothetical protein
MVFQTQWFGRPNFEQKPSLKHAFGINMLMPLEFVNSHDSKQKKFSHDLHAPVWQSRQRDSKHHPNAQGTEGSGSNRQIEHGGQNI